MPELSIIMPCYNRAHDLIKALQAYDCQKGEAEFELVAVDDASSDATYEVLTSYQPTRYKLRVERMPENKGPAIARNHGIARATSPVILFVGDDILPDERLVEGHISAHRHYKSLPVAVLGRCDWPDNLPVNTLMAHIDGIGAQQFSYHFLQDRHEYDFRHFYTANISIKRDFLSRLDHYFDPTFRFAAYEDAELAYRLSKIGLRIVYSSILVGQHYHYHTIWSFSQRQQKSGMMGALLVAKHPELRYAFRAHELRIWNLLRQIREMIKPFSPTLLDMFAEMTCHLASYYEWNPNRLLDRLYLSVLDYFYYDGFIQGRFGNAKFSLRLRSAHASRYLLPTLKWYLEQAKQLGIPAPDASRLTWLSKLTKQ
jgi:glycosyltransferase involved in cell wall biosynthesis